MHRRMKTILLSKVPTGPAHKSWNLQSPVSKNREGRVNLQKCGWQWKHLSLTLGTCRGSVRVTLRKGTISSPRKFINVFLCSISTRTITPGVSDRPCWDVSACGRNHMTRQTLRYSVKAVRSLGRNPRGMGTKKYGKKSVTFAIML